MIMNQLRESITDHRDILRPDLAYVGALAVSESKSVLYLDRIRGQTLWVYGLRRVSYRYTI